jgi:hypothetical protein
MRISRYSVSPGSNLVQQAHVQICGSSGICGNTLDRYFITGRDINGMSCGGIAPENRIRGDCALKGGVHSILADS